MRINKGWIITIISLLIFSSFPITSFAEENTDNEDSIDESTGKFSMKDEVIYGKLNGHGKINNMYVVNTFHTTEPGKIVDYGNYTDIRNLTDLSAIDQTNGNEVHFQADEGDFYYQGELTNLVLPWDISIDYVLDGKKVNMSELAGQTGALEIQITTTQNKAVDSTFFENYLMQISVSFDPTIFSNIQAPKGTEANEGKNKLFTFSVMPDTEEELIISADVENLEMDPINISAIPANIAIENPDIGDMKDEMQELADAIGEINSGVADLSDGIAELNNGTTKLSNGSSDYSAGMSQLDQGSGELVYGSKEIRNALQQISKELEGGAEIPDLGDMTELPEGLKQIAEGLRGAAARLEELSEGYNGAYDALNGAIEEIPNGGLDEQYIQEQIGALYQSDADPDFVDQLTKTYEAAQKVKHIYKAPESEQLFAAVSGMLAEMPGQLNMMAEPLETMATGIESAMENLDQLDALTDLQKGLSTLASEYSAFHNGLVEYTEGVHSLATNYQNLDSGIKELSSGTAELADGASQLHDGTSELESATSDIPEEMQSEIDKLLEEYDNKDFKPVSFVSDKNESVGVVQFVLQTESIEIEKPEENENKKEEKKGVWERFLDLFR